MDGAALERVRELTAAEDDATAAARQRAGRTTVPTPEIGALLRWVAISTAARSAVEVGSAGGVSGLWLVRGMTERGILTTIDDDPHAHGLATEAFERVGAGSRVRAILGDPDEVLPRLSDGAYDLVVLQGSAFGTIDPLEHGRRLLRTGGILVALELLASGDHADARARFVQALADDPSFASVVLPIDHGVALATRQEDPTEGASEGASEA
ncbi:MAG: class I SAM-dependent methyltransferase [Nitriliruptor sp.]